MYLAYVVDDSPDYRLLLGHFFKRFLPEQTIQFFDGAKSMFEQLAKVRESNGNIQMPSSIVMDFNMPGISGLEALYLLKNPGDKRDDWWRDIPVMINSGMLDEEVVQMCFENGASAFFNKSADIEELNSLCAFLRKHAKSLETVQ